MERHVLVRSPFIFLLVLSRKSGEYYEYFQNLFFIAVLKILRFYGNPPMHMETAVFVRFFQDSPQVRYLVTGTEAESGTHRLLRRPN